MSAHTPGPWKACNGGNCSCGQVWSIPGDCPVFTALEDGSRQVVGLACDKWGDAPEIIYGAVGQEQQRANARLIAAAPELLAELQHLVRLLEPLELDGALHVPGLATLNGARAAIAKAGAA